MDKCAVVYVTISRALKSCKSYIKQLKIRVLDKIVTSDE
jgi:hypothetical protein